MQIRARTHFRDPGKRGAIRAHERDLHGFGRRFRSGDLLYPLCWDFLFDEALFTGMTCYSIVFSPYTRFVFQYLRVSTVKYV